jgi:hypothetical protein
LPSRFVQFRGIIARWADTRSSLAISLPSRTHCKRVSVNNARNFERCHGLPPIVKPLRKFCFS